MCFYNLNLKNEKNLENTVERPQMDAVCFYTAFKLRLNELCQGGNEIVYFKMLTTGRTDFWPKSVPLKKNIHN